MAVLIIKRITPGVTLQDAGRPGYLAQGLSRGGAADPLALAEGAALLGQDPGLAALEMAGAGGEFEADEDLRIALTGAPMQVSIEGTLLVWNASHLLPRGSRLKIGGCTRGNYGYLHIGGGIASALHLGSRSSHAGAGLGQMLQNGTRLTIGSEAGGKAAGQRLDIEDRFEGGTLHLLRGPQSHLFSARQIAQFEAAQFRRDRRGNRMGAGLSSDQVDLTSARGLKVLSEVIVPGDVQITGDGTPFVLLSDCQTMGGYPRIGTVLPSHLPKVAQARPGTAFRFQFVSQEEAAEIEARAAARRAELPKSLRPLVRDPATMQDLLAYQLISGVTAGDDLERSAL